MSLLLCTVDIWTSLCLFLVFSNYLLHGNPTLWCLYLDSHFGVPDGGAWWAAVHGVARSRTQLSDFTCTFHFHALEKETATHSSVLAWRIPGRGEPGGLLSLGLHRVRHDWSDLAAAAAAAAEVLSTNDHWPPRRLSSTCELSFQKFPKRIKLSFSRVEAKRESIIYKNLKHSQSSGTGHLLAIQRQLISGLIFLVFQYIVHQITPWECGSWTGKPIIFLPSRVFLSGQF